jgi:hypothetical protein
MFGIVDRIGIWWYNLLMKAVEKGPGNNDD